MAFPQTKLPITVDLRLGTTWTDITSDVRGDAGVGIQRGFSKEGTSADHGQCSLTLENVNGKYCPRNPSSPYYGLIGRNTPIRVSVAGGEPYLLIPNTANDRASTPDDAALDITGDIDIRMEFSMEDWDVDDTTEMVGKYNVSGNQRSWRVLLGSGGLITYSWSPDGTAVTDVTSTRGAQGGATGRGAIRVTHDVNDGAGGNVVRFYFARTINGPWDQLGSAVTTVGTTSIFNSTASLEIGDISNLSFTVPDMKVHAFELRNGIDGTEVANPDFTVQTVGAGSFTDAAGRTWTMNSDAAITDKQVRFVGEVSSWPVKWDAGAFDVTTMIEASGILRRLSQGVDPLKSALTRTIPTDSTVLAYWPMEDNPGAELAATPLPGVGPMQTTGLTFGAESPTASGIPAGSDALPQVAAGSTISGEVPSPSGASTHFQVEFLFKIPTAPTTGRTILSVLSTGTIKEWAIILDNTNATINGFSSTGAVVTSDVIASTGNFFGGWRRCRLYVYQDGGDVSYNHSWFTLGGATLNSGGNTYAAATLGRCYRVVGPSTGYHADLAGMGIGHVAVFDAAFTDVFTGADIGFDGDTAGERMNRLSGEEGVNVVVSGLVADQVTLGPQGSESFLELVQEAAAADVGMLFERRESTALAYRDRSTLYDQRITLTLPYEAVKAPLEPVDDDQQVKNDITVSRSNGTSARAVDETSALSVLPPPSGVGRYTDSVTLNLSNDNRTEQLAGWKLFLGTWDETRYPNVSVNLARNPELMAEAARVEVGDRIVITDPPSFLPPGDIDLMVIGYSEQFSQFEWTISYVCLPYGPWHVGMVEDDDYGRVDTDGSTLSEGLTTTETDISMFTQSGSARWVDSATYPDDFPFDIIIGGEVMTVTAITGTTSSQTFTVTRSVNGIVKTHSSGASISLATPAYVAL